MTNDELWIENARLRRRLDDAIEEIDDLRARLDHAESELHDVDADRRFGRDVPAREHEDALTDVRDDMPQRGAA